ncbi:MAG TPA: archaeal proteasome endopeptidase complex subunit beta [Candidatus Thermoplasmatota archaeon]|nr:archaeal proteasome endopeptidase complex subunit beta [Candidatus Thermoplasmatota archaeon]
MDIVLPSNGPPQLGAPSKEAEGPKTLKTGTTTVGIVCADGVVLGADMRATMGHLIAHKQTDKLFKVADHLGMTIAGSVGDAQTLVRWLTAEVELYQVKRGAPMSVKAAATLMANILNQRKFTPFYVQLLVGGVDLEGGAIYSLDAAGGSIPDKFVTTGSGSVFVYGVLEDHYKDGMTIEEGLDLAVRGIAAAMKRDSASGDGMNVCSITRKDGFKLLAPEDIAARRKRMGI